MLLPTTKKSMRPVALPLALALHLLALYALDKWSTKHHFTVERREKEFAILLLPAPRAPAKPQTQPAAEQSESKPQRAAKAQSLAATPKQVSERSLPLPETASELVPPDPVIPPAPGVGTTDPAALVKANGYVDTRSELRKTIEAHGGVVEIPPKNKYQVFAEAMDAAQIPYCLAANGLKHDPPHIGPIGLEGELAIPFVVDAAIRGKCKIMGH